MNPEDIATRFQSLLEGYKAGQAAELASAARAATAEVVAWLQSAGEPATALERRRLASRAAKQLKARLGAIARRGGATLREALPAIAKETARFEQQALTELLGQAEAGPRLHKVPAAAVVDAVQAVPLVATGRPVLDEVQRFVDTLPGAYINRVRAGYMRGETTAEIARALRGTAAKRFKDGFGDLTARQARTVANTVVQHAASAAREEVWRRNPDVVSAYRFVATLDGRTSPVCRSLDGQEFKVGDGPTPPVHVNCRSTTVPVLDPDLGLGFLDRGATRASKDGPVGAGTTYYGWLKRQPARFQDAVLGLERGRLFRNGGISAERFAALSLDRNFKPRTLDELRELLPTAFDKAGL